MTDPVTLEHIKGLSDLFKKHGVCTLDDLRMCIGFDVDSGVSWISSNTGASQALVIALLIAEAPDAAASKGRRRLLRYWRSLKTFPAVFRLTWTELKLIWPNKKLLVLWEVRGSIWACLGQSFVRPHRLWHNRVKYWPDLLVIVLSLLLLTGAGLRAKSIIKSEAQYVVVKHGTSLPAFHQINKDDLDTKKDSLAKGSFNSPEQAIGLYTLVPITPGALLQANQLLRRDLSGELRGRKILSVPIKLTAYGAALKPPASAVMLLSPRAPDSKVPPAPFEVIVLSIDIVGDSKMATVALTEEKFLIAAPLLASHDVFLSLTAP